MIIRIPGFSANGVIVPTPVAAWHHGLYRRGAKRLLDLCAVALAAPVAAPLIAGVAIAVALDGGKPFYCQSRVGKGGRIFRMWKLRSMVPDADARMDVHLAAFPEARAEWDTTQKLKNDPLRCAGSSV
jgi:exopolysaccharide production protein ExoY